MSEIRSKHLNIQTMQSCVIRPRPRPSLHFTPAALTASKKNDQKGAASWWGPTNAVRSVAAKPCESASMPSPVLTAATVLQMGKPLHGLTGELSRGHRLPSKGPP